MSRFIETWPCGCYLLGKPGTGASPGASLRRIQVLSTSASAASAANQTASVGPEAGAPHTHTHHDATSQDALARVLDSLDSDKAEDVVQIDLRGKTTLADYMVICTGRSSRQVAAIAEKLVDRLKHDLGCTSRVEGKETGDWVLIDTGDVIVHVFRPEVRDFYQLEKMWLPAGQAPAPSSASA